MHVAHRISIAAVVVVAAALAVAAPASAASIVVTPNTVAIGGTTTVSGDVLVNGQPGCAVPSQVTLISNAFAGLGEFAGEGAVTVDVDATGHFSSVVNLDSRVAAGVYDVTGRCGGGNLGVSATLTVAELPPTGPSIAGHDPFDVALLGLGVVAVGLLAVVVGRGRRVPVRP
jgi:hypothetical protein